MAKRIPIRAARDVAMKYGLDQVILVAFSEATGLTHVVTYGRTLEDCSQAAVGGNMVKRALGWPEELCKAEPARVRKRKATKQ